MLISMFRRGCDGILEALNIPEDPLKGSCSKIQDVQWADVFANELLHLTIFVPLGIQCSQKVADGIPRSLVLPGRLQVVALTS